MSKNVIKVIFFPLIGLSNITGSITFNLQSAIYKHRVVLFLVLTAVSHGHMSLGVAFSNKESISPN